MGDLFGEIAVSLQEIQLWLYKVPRLPHYATRRASYVRQWNVVDKIRAAKRRGDLSAILGDCSCEFCGRELESDQAAIPAVDPAIELSLLRRRVQVLELLLRPGKEKPGLVSRVRL
jgi:hypothetical protein